MILDLRLNILDKYVQKFVITESIYTHSGKKRDLRFNINNFSKFKDKIEYIVVDDLPNTIEIINEKDSFNQKNSKILLNALRRENYQRNRLIDGLQKVDNEDLIIISDVDEIPNLSNFKYKYKFNFFIQKMIYYKLNLKHPSLNWVGSRACKKKDLVSPQWLRNIKDKDYMLWRLDVLFSNKKYFNINRVNEGGWHFTSIKSPEDIHFKLSHFLHHLEYEESKLNIEDMKKIVEEKKVLYDHASDKRGSKWSSSISLEKISENLLPEYIVKNKDKYKEWLD
tara:strand:+ start:124 stop:966 length:843 start_codon:yes stop_codon:yes gene_type:complete